MCPIQDGSTVTVRWACIRLKNILNSIFILSLFSFVYFRERQRMRTHVQVGGGEEGENLRPELDLITVRS